jgi:uncharacterized protein (DUF1330 family)
MQEIDDVNRYRNEYVPGVRPFLQKHGAELLVGSFDAEPAEGEPPNSTVVIRFTGAAMAHGGFNTPGGNDPAVSVDLGGAGTVFLEKVAKAVNGMTSST